MSLWCMRGKSTENHYILWIICKIAVLRFSVGGLYGIQFHHGRKERENLCVSIVSRGSEIVKSYARCYARARGKKSDGTRAPSEIACNRK